MNRGREEGYSTFFVEREFKIPRNSQQQWIDRGIIRPSIERAEGRGSRNLYSRDDLFQLLLMKTLMNSFGIALKQARAIVQFLDAQELARMTEVCGEEFTHIFITGSDGEADGYHPITANQPIESVLAYKAAMVINLRAIKNQLDAKLG